MPREIKPMEGTCPTCNESSDAAYETPLTTLRDDPREETEMWCCSNCGYPVEDMGFSLAEGVDE